MGSKRLLLLFLTVALVAGGWYWALRPDAARPMVVGVLHSLTGSMAASEAPVVDGVLLAIEELNEAGGVLGRPVRPVVVDGRSDAETFAREAERLIARERVVTVFGCWTSASRKTVKPVFERHDHLLVYPVQYEGLEDSPNIGPDHVELIGYSEMLEEEAEELGRAGFVADLRKIRAAGHPGRRLDHAEVRRHRPGAHDHPAFLRDDGRRHPGPE
jgi:Periplasmic binding protein domain